MTQPADAPRKLLLVKLLPNLVSILALCAGLTAIRFGIAGNFTLAVLLIGVAAALDGLDGRLARMLKSESAIGAELDSLCDFVNFGVTPALILYLWGLRPETSLGWIAVLVYVVCCMLRLARFNVGSKVAVGEAAEKSSFIGVPSPAGAMLVLSPLYLSFATGGAVQLPPVLVAAWMVGIGALMISRVRTPSFKRITIATDHARHVLVAAVVVVAALLTYPWVTLLTLCLGYLGGVLWLAVRNFRWSPIK
ncbi:CDP-diacylglycerol--serine O-phosphatidyltransferase [Tabrizicola sp.]|jgi:CDP-diacylglycerol---serine O-phosphatidyltransferase|uniref:CDP-diacylglycerol--serine O-phosphatidyltransferase n=1 Tax=Tabrizicola sp. TaxID=2005166 RepID=UPI000BD3B798|nr:CDP-diacylglycerol--serine O-phosphatidyltransferase [Tabrizicola sp.]MBY0351299.1 CDP-diacylglycerol--serine O-phosphatidyltransferase [Tabrizicola sp.]OYX18240.1 MAG: CDP-diacylglycerol--serine O-phosphatidyltransferase [Rhodobacterales bacterium 32-66-9]